jgi:DNA-directed RNA polymerase subunit M/transcription elongation factor TFIIS
MKKLDQQEQWHQLTDTYRQMTEEELCQVAADAFDLVPIAREALQAVISEKGLKVQPALAPPAPQPTASDGDGFIDDPGDSEDPDYELVCVCTVQSESEAKQLKALLDANFIASCLGPENIVDLEHFKGSFDGGVELKVHALNSRRASNVLDLYAPEQGEEDPDEDKEYAVLCPKCHSQEVFLRDDGPQAEATAAEVKFKWQCDGCGHQWEDEGIEEKL